MARWRFMGFSVTAAWWDFAWKGQPTSVIVLLRFSVRRKLLQV